MRVPTWQPDAERVRVGLLTETVPGDDSNVIGDEVRPGMHGSGVQQLDSAIQMLEGVRTEAKRDPDFGLDLPWCRFARTMRLLTPQSYGGRFQRWLQRFYGWEPVRSQDDRGDCVDGAGHYWEVKVTLITGTNVTANFVQLRPYQEVDGHALFVVDAFDDYRVHRFDLGEGELREELDRSGLNAHGTHAAVASNATREYALRFPWGDAGRRAHWEGYRSSAPVPVASSRVTSQ